MGHRWFLTLFLIAITSVFGQSYKVANVVDGGTISGTIKWAGVVPRGLEMPIKKDSQICDPEGKKTADLERLIVGPEGGVANTIVYLKNISSGKPFDLPPQRRHLDQKRCRYIPHILLVPQNEILEMQSSDPTLHTIHMDGAATFNLPFPFVGKPTSRAVSTPGLVNLRCNGGHVWMNAEMMVVSLPSNTKTDVSENLKSTNVPRGNYLDFVLHEGWVLAGKQQA